MRVLGIRRPQSLVCRCRCLCASMQQTWAVHLAWGAVPASAVTGAREDHDRRPRGLAQAVCQVGILQHNDLSTPSSAQHSQIAKSDYQDTMPCCRSPEKTMHSGSCMKEMWLQRAQLPSTIDWLPRQSHEPQQVGTLTCVSRACWPCCLFGDTATAWWPDVVRTCDDRLMTED